MATQFKRGDVVVLKWGGPNMIVEECTETQVNVKFWNTEAQKYEFTRIDAKVLEIFIDPPPITDKDRSRKFKW
jgi:uncharacterized protein YodC (DUF2158 family)